MRPIVTRYNISLTLAHPCFESYQDVEPNSLQEENSQPVEAQWHVVDFFICRIEMELVCLLGLPWIFCGTIQHFYPFFKCLMFFKKLVASKSEIYGSVVIVLQWLRMNSQVMFAEQTINLQIKKYSKHLPGSKLLLDPVSQETESRIKKINLMQPNICGINLEMFLFASDNSYRFPCSYLQLERRSCCSNLCLYIAPV